MISLLDHANVLTTTTLYNICPRGQANLYAITHLKESVMLRKKSILDMFARSPMRPLQRHIEKANACVELLLPFYRAIQNDQWDESEAAYNAISELEREADDLKRDLRIHLPKGLFLPVPRSDLLVLLNKQEILPNTAKDIAGIMLGRKMQLPAELAGDFEKYLSRSIAASKQATLAISELDELLESGFRGREVTITDKMIQELNVIEHESDEMQVTLRRSLFKIEKTLEPVDVMFLYQVINWVGHLADGAQQVGYQLQLLLAD